MSTSIRSEDRFSDSGEGNDHASGNAQPQDDDSRTPLLGAVTVQSRSMLDKISSLLQNWWLWEIVGAATSVVCISIILVILLLYNSSSLPDWPFIFNVRMFWILIFKSRLTADNILDQFHYLFIWYDCKVVPWICCECSN